MATKIIIKPVEPKSKSFTKIADLSVGDLYTFTYDSGSNVVGVVVLVADAVKRFMPLNVAVWPPTSPACDDKLFLLWDQDAEAILCGKFTPFIGSITLKSE